MPSNFHRLIRNLRKMIEREEATYCDGCKKFSLGVACSYCKPDPAWQGVERATTPTQEPKR